MKTLTIAKYASFVFASALSLHSAELIVNGGFESGFSGWTRMNAPGSDGTFLLQTGTSSPVNGLSVPAPPGGVSAAMTDAEGPGAHVLYQDFMVTAPVDTATLRFDMFLGNQSGFFTPSPNTLDFGVAAFNQQARVDILLGTASIFSLSGTDVLLNVYQTTTSTAAGLVYMAQSQGIASILNSHLNTALRLRFAETDNVGFFQLGIDNVSLETTPVPEPSSLMTGALGVALCLTLAAFRRKGSRSMYIH